ncbi:MAG: Na/Pi cotransporter family protein [Clostridiales bacterium]|nr:Na/Pi cotransporter family protein [Clostridiales bacterium]
MDFFSILTLFGGLAIFLFGMNVMGEGLEKCSGGRLKAILENLTSSPIKSVLLGAGVTAIIQSSSATTVMVVGFVNSGIMRLSQTIGIIMGANVGTTVTSWLLSLSGISSDNFFIRLLKPSSFAPVLACVGVVMTTFLKGERKHNIGSILIGFGVLMTGMELMSGSVKPLAEVPEFRNILILFSNPVLGVLTGALLTAVIQSSSASVGILQALAVTGGITYSNAIPIIMGQNIGTCVTAILSAIGANKNAKRTAVVHLSFNIIGTLVFLILYYSLNALLHFSFVTNSINAAGIALIHSIFNIFSTVLMLPFSRQLERLAMLIIPDDETQEKYDLLDERLLATPSVASHQAKSIADNMGMYCVDSFDLLQKLFAKFSTSSLESIRDNENTVDSYEDKLGTYLVKLSHESLTLDDSHMISTLLHTIGDFERISDHETNIAAAVEELHSKSMVFSAAAVRELNVLLSAVSEILMLTTNAFVKNDIEGAKGIEPLEQLIDKLTVKMKRHHIKRLKSGECSIESGFPFSDILTSCERIADHCSNIAVCIIQVSDDSFDTHEYLNQVKYEGENDFNEKYNMYKQKYRI